MLENYRQLITLARALSLSLSTTNIASQYLHD